MGRQKLKYIVFFVFCLGLSKCIDNKAKILIIGDSISIGYTPFVKEKLKEIASVYHNRGNAQHTGVGLKKINSWLKSDQWDIIQFNFGLWDICYRNNDLKFPNNKDKITGEITIEIDEYERNLDSLVKMIKKKSKAKLIFVTTTFVPQNNSGRFTQDVISYNNVAIKVMKKHNIAIHDVYEQSSVIHEKYGESPSNVHYTKEGYVKLSEIISDHFKEILKMSTADASTTN